MRKILIMKSNTNKRSYLFLFKLLPLTAMVVLLQACFVAKPYQRPKNVLDDARYRTDQLQGDTSNIASLSWTELFTDEKLAAYINQALDQNLDIRNAIQQINAAEAYFKQGKAGFSQPFL